MKDEIFFEMIMTPSEESDDILEALLEKQFKKYAGKFFSKINPSEKLEQLKEEIIIDRLNFICNYAHTKTQYICLSKLLNDKIYEYKKQTKVRRKLIELLTIIEERRYYDGTLQDYSFISYVIFKEQNLEYLKQIVAINSSLLRSLDENGNTLFYNILKRYLSLNSCQEQEIYYYFQVLSFCFNKEEEHIIKDKMIYLSLINHANMEELHVQKALSFFKPQRCYSKEALYDKYAIHQSKIYDPTLIINTGGYNYGYQDFRNQEVLTIDSDTDICLDDGFYLEKKDDEYLLYIHIADIPSLVPIRKQIDKEAYHQAETIYLKDQILSMLPPYISDNLASLLPNKDTKVITYIVHFDLSFHLIEEKFEITRGIISSKHKLSYIEADKIITGIKESSITEELTNMYFISQNLKQSNPSKEIYRKIENMINGYNHKGSHHESTITDTSASANIVQEFMILINRSIARYFHQKGLPFIYRTHQLYDNELSIYIQDFNQKIKEYNQNINIDNYQKMIKLMSKLLLNARYSNVCMPHQGLNLECYSHSTSPARRYADIINEQIIYQFIFNEFSDKDVYAWENITKEKSVYLNERHKQNIDFANEYHQLIRRR